VEAAEPLKDKLLERGVLVVPLPIFKGDAAPEAASNGAAVDGGSSDLRQAALKHLTSGACAPRIGCGLQISALPCSERKTWERPAQVEGHSSAIRGVERLVSGAGQACKCQPGEGPVHQPAAGRASPWQRPGSATLAAPCGPAGAPGRCIAHSHCTLHDCLKKAASSVHVHLLILASHDSNTAQVTMPGRAFLTALMVGYELLQHFEVYVLFLCRRALARRDNCLLGNAIEQTCEPMQQCSIIS
jgi:hypothetical protein